MDYEAKMLGWLERSEEILGFSEVQSALTDMEKAQELFYNELGYDISGAQFERLQAASELRYEEMPAIGVSSDLIDRAWGFQRVYRDVITGRFVSGADVVSLLSTIRGK